MKESGPSRRQFLAGLLGIAGGAEVVRRHPDTTLEAAALAADDDRLEDFQDEVTEAEPVQYRPDTVMDNREIGPVDQPRTYRDFLARYSRESGQTVTLQALQTGSNMVLQIEVNGFVVPFELFELTPPPGTYDFVAYTWFREKLIDFLRTIA